MALSKEARDWLLKHGPEGLLRVAEAPPHEEPEKVATTINLDELFEGTVQAAVELPSRGLYSIENPSTQILTEYFGEFSFTSKVYQT